MCPRITYPPLNVFKQRCYQRLESFGEQETTVNKFESDLLFRNRQFGDPLVMYDTPTTGKDILFFKEGIDTVLTDN